MAWHSLLSIIHPNMSPTCSGSTPKNLVALQMKSRLKLLSHQSTMMRPNLVNICAMPWRLCHCAWDTIMQLMFHSFHTMRPGMQTVRQVCDGETSM